MTTARFWTTHHGSPVKVTLTSTRPVLHHREGRTTDEGWSAHGQDFALHEDLSGAWVVREDWTDGRDCDGRISTNHAYDCGLDRLKAGPHAWLPQPLHSGHVVEAIDPEIRFPAWDRLTSGQRDYTAESMNY